VRTNLKASAAVLERTYEGAIAKRITPEQELRRSVMACLLWEDQFYEDGVQIAKRIESLVAKVSPLEVRKIAVEARTKMKLRHVPLHIALSLLRAHQNHTASLVIEEVIQRPDELTELLSLYWGKKKTPLAHAVKKGLARAFGKFNEYQLAKYNRAEAIKLRDVMFLVHPKPKDEEQAAVWKKLAEGKLETPDTWEVKLSEAHTPEEKRAVWVGLLERKHLGAMALLRNLRNMIQVAVPDSVIKTGLENMKVDRVLPFRFLTAARYAPKFEPELEQAMFRCLSDQEKLPGHTTIVLDVSGSMVSAVSGKSEVTRMDAACGVAILLREICEDIGVVAFSTQAATVAPRRGMALRDAIVNSMHHGGTNTETALVFARSQFLTSDRIIVITDEQSHETISGPGDRKGYFINVASAKNGVGYGDWTHIDGWSEAVVDYIREYERSA